MPEVSEVDMTVLCGDPPVPLLVIPHRAVPTIRSPRGAHGDDEPAIATTVVDSRAWQSERSGSALSRSAHATSVTGAMRALILGPADGSAEWEVGREVKPWWDR
jgi:hypothetical protein